MDATVPGQIKVGDHVRWRSEIDLNLVWQVTVATETMLRLEIDIAEGAGYRRLVRTVDRQQCLLVGQQHALDID